MELKGSRFPGSLSHGNLESEKNTFGEHGVLSKKT